MDTMTNGHANGTGVITAHQYAVPQRPPQNSVPNSAFSAGQLEMLKCQIHVYKCISSNKEIPPNVLEGALKPIPNAMKPRETTTPATAQHPEVSFQQPGAPFLSASPATPASVPGPQKPHPNAYSSPYDHLKKPISYSSHASRQQCLLVPSILPAGVDPQMLRTEREDRIKLRLERRISELESSAHLGDKENDSSECMADALKDFIELKTLKLYEKQQALRDELTNGMTKSTRLATPADKRLVHKPKKILSMEYAFEISRVDHAHRKAYDERKEKERASHFIEIFEHKDRLVRAHDSWRKRRRRLADAVLEVHRHTEKQEREKRDKLSKERIEALKNDDEEAYMKLLDTTKDTRLTQLLQQTGTFLESLSKAVVDQQNDTARMIDFHDDDAETSDDAHKGDYFQVAHHIKEEVSQANILVGGKLKDYQLKGLQWMVSLYNNRLNGILADEMGLGKTIQTISLITYLIERKNVHGPFLVIVPLSTMSNWTLEFEKWAPSVSKIAFKGQRSERLRLEGEIRSRNFQVLLTTYEYICKERPLLSKVNWAHMIIDEGHRLKNDKSKLSSELRTYYKTTHRLILTGTPLQNNLPELWALLNFILPKIFKSAKNFEEWFNSPFSKQGVQDKVPLNEEEQLLIIKRLHKVLRPFLLRRLKKDVESDLPDKVERVIKCKMSALQANLTSQMMKRTSFRTLPGIPDRKKAPRNYKLMQLRKICNHPFVFEEVENVINPEKLSNEILYRVSGKFELLDRILPKLYKTKHRVLVFFQMTEFMTIMEDFLNFRGYQYLRLDGATNSEDRSGLLEVFNAPDSPYFLFLLSTRAGGIGLNLQTADTVIIFDSDWNPHQDLQAMDRAHRIGQTKNVLILRLVTSSSVEELILERAHQKLDMDGKVIQAGKFDHRSTDEDSEAILRSMLEDKEDEDKESDDDMLDDDELNKMLMRSEEELTIFEEMDADQDMNEDRLFRENELPDFMKHWDVEEVEEMPLDSFGRGQRAKDTNYADMFSDEDEAALVEQGNDNDRAYRSFVKLPKRNEMMEEMYDEPNKKRGRPKKGEELNRKRVKKDSDRPIDPHTQRQMADIFMKCYQAVEEDKEEGEDGDKDSYRPRAYLFMKPVNKRKYPDYYKIITSPISMKEIKKRIDDNDYTSIAEFKADFHLMFDNARTYNAEGSMVYDDANVLQDLLDTMLSQLCPGDKLPAMYEPANEMHVNSLGGKYPFGYGNVPGYGHDMWPMDGSAQPPMTFQEQYGEDEDEDGGEEDEYDDDDYKD